MTMDRLDLPIATSLLQGFSQIPLGLCCQLQGGYDDDRIAELLLRPPLGQPLAEAVGLARAGRDADFVEGARLCCWIQPGE